MTALALLILLAVAWTLLFLRPAAVLWTLIMAVTLLLTTFYIEISNWINSLLWIFFLLAAIFANIMPLRILLFSAPFLRYFRKTLPPMSATEREALEAGDVWWEGDLFVGRPNWKKLHAIPKPTLTQEEQAFINQQTETLCALLDDWKIVQQDCDLTPQTWDYLKKAGFLGLVIDKKYGGKGFSALAHSTIVAKIATRSMSAAVNTMVPNSLGPAELLMHYGTEEQKDYYLPRLAVGEEIPCFALTSVEAGSDATAMQDYGIVCKGQYQGKEVTGIKLTWNKRYITLAPIATVLGLAFKLYDPEHLLGQQEALGITVCLISTAQSGVQMGERHYPMNMAFQNGPTQGKDVFVPLDAVIGGAKMVGKGWRMLMECLSIGRSISLPALSTATGILSYHTTGIYALLRQQFKISIGQFEGVQAALAQIAGNTYLLEASRQMTAGAVDLKVKPSIVSAIQKYHATELARVINAAALDVHAGRAIQLGPRNYLGQTYLAMPIAITVEGANILTRNLIIFGQGAVRCHPYILEEMQAANETNGKLARKKFDRVLKSHLGYTLSNIVRAFSFGVTNARFVGTPTKQKWTYYYRQLTRMSTALALTSDFAMLLLGGQLKRRERLSARLGDILSHLYLATTLLKYYADQGEIEADAIYVKWGLESCLLKIQTAFDDFFRNFPMASMAKLLRFLIFPYGRCYRGPDDSLEAQLANSTMKPSATRARLTQHVYAIDDVEDNIGRLNAAFKAATDTYELEQRLKQAIVAGKLSRKMTMKQRLETAVQVNIINTSEAEQLVQARELLQQAMEVDVFAKDYLAKRMCPE